MDEATKKKVNPVGLLQSIKGQAALIIVLMPSANMRDRARKIYDLAKELQDDLAK